MKEKARDLINRHLVTTLLSTADERGNADAALFNSASMPDPNTVVGAQIGLKRSYENLKKTRRGVISVIVPHPEDPLKTDGVRVYVELVADETEGEGFDELQRSLDRSLGVGFRLKSRLVFKVTEIRPLWEW
jgi:hypothetical protein